MGKQGQVYLVMTRLRVGQSWAEECASGRSTLKLVQIIPLTQRSQRVDLRYCPYYISILISSAPSNELLWKAEANYR